MNKLHGGQGKTHGLLQGAALLGGAAILSKLIGTLQKIPLQNLAGDEVFGIYNAVYPLYIFILTLATAGVPIAVSKFVSDYAAKGDEPGTERVFRMASWMLTLTGWIGFAALYGGSGAIASAIGIPKASAAIKSVSFALLFAPFMAVLRGYFQGLRTMVPTALSQVLEQMIRVTVMIGLLLWLTAQGAGEAAIAAGATFGSAAGAVGGIGILLWFRRRKFAAEKAGERNKRSTQNSWITGDAGNEASEPLGALIRRFVRFIIPICIGTLALPVLTLVDTFTVPRLLIRHGAAYEEASRLFGIYNHGLPLVQLITMVAASMSAALVPSVAEAAASGDRAKLVFRTEPVLRFTWLVGTAASCGLAVSALPLNVMFFRSPEGWQAMSIVAFTAVFATLHVVSGSMLQGMGAVMVPASSMFIAAALKIAGNLLLVPALGLQGAAAAAVAAYAAAAALNLRALRRTAGIAVLPRGVLRPLAAAALMSLAAAAVAWGLEEALRLLAPPVSYRLRFTAAALGAVLAGAMTYGAALLRFSAVTEAELQILPGFDARWKPVLVKLRLLRP